MTFENTIKEFVDIIGNPDDMTALEKYVNFVLDNTIDVPTEEYAERHHIIPRCIKKDDNDVTHTLLYHDHIKAHELLYEAYKLPMFGNPLRFMTPDKSSEIMSEMRKKQWENMSIETKEELSKIRSYNASNTNKRWLSKHMSDARKKICEDNPDLYESYRQKLRDSWTEEKRESVSKRMKEIPSSEYSRRTKMRWDNISDDDYSAFCEKMKAQNADETIKEKNRQGVKKKWEDPEFREMMRQKQLGKNKGKKRPNIAKLWEDPEFRDRQKAIRKKAFVTKKFPDVEVTDENVDALYDVYKESNRKMTSSELSNRPEVATLSRYYSLEKLHTGKKKPIGYYRKSTEYLLSEINRISKEYGVLDETEEH